MHTAPVELMDQQVATHIRARRIDQGITLQRWHGGFGEIAIATSLTSANVPRSQHGNGVDHAA